MVDFSFSGQLKFLNSDLASNNREYEKKQRAPFGEQFKKSIFFLRSNGQMLTAKIPLKRKPIIRS